MSLKEAYAEVATRYAQSADAALNKHIQESAAFQAYHAFESIGGALAESHGHKYPLAHDSKLNVFTAVSKRKNYGLHVAELGIIFASLRNKVLYPEVSPGTGAVIRPNHRIAQTDAKKLLSRVKGIIKHVSKEI